MINRADLLVHLKRSDEAIAIYEQLLSGKSCGDERYLIYGNLIDILLETRPQTGIDISDGQSGSDAGCGRQTRSKPLWLQFEQVFSLRLSVLR